MNIIKESYIETTQGNFLLFKSVIDALNDDFFWAQKSQQTADDIFHVLSIRYKVSNHFSKETLYHSILGNRAVKEKDYYIWQKLFNYISHDKWLLLDVLNYDSVSLLWKKEVFFWLLWTTLQWVNNKINSLIQIENRKDNLSSLSIEQYLEYVENTWLKNFTIRWFLAKLRKHGISNNIIGNIATKKENKKKFLLENLTAVNSLNDCKENAFMTNDSLVCCLFWITGKDTIYIEIKDYNDWYIRNTLESTKKKYNYKSLFILKNPQVHNNK